MSGNRKVSRPWDFCILVFPISGGKNWKPTGWKPWAKEVKLKEYDQWDACWFRLKWWSKAWIWMPIS